LKKVLDRRAGDDRILLEEPSFQRVFLAVPALFLEVAYARTTVHVCEGACLRFLRRRVLLALAFPLQLRPAISVTLHPAPLRSESDARLVRNGLGLSEPGVICGAGQFGSLDHS